MTLAPPLHFPTVEMERRWEEGHRDGSAVPTGSQAPTGRPRSLLPLPQQPLPFALGGHTPSPEGDMAGPFSIMTQPERSATSKRYTQSPVGAERGDRGDLSKEPMKSERVGRSWQAAKGPGAFRAVEIQMGRQGCT